MDAIKILGSLLRNNAIGSDVGGNVLESLLGGGGGGGSQAADILGTLLGGSKRTGGGGGKGMGALGAILAAAAAANLRDSKRGGSSPLDMIGDVLGGASQGKSGGGLGEVLGGLLGGGQSSGGGGLLGSLLPGGSKPGGEFSRLLGAQATGGVSGTELLGLVLGAGEKAEPPQEAQDEAEILIEAMCNAAKIDGKIDESEREAILGKLGDLDDEEVAFLREELTSPIDIPDFTARVPEDMKEQVYAFSLMAIKLDDRQEVQYFSHLSQSLEIPPERCNEIHSRLGQPQIFV